MTHDDELRRRMNRMADEADLGTVTLETVEARGRQRTQRQQIFAVAAAFIFVAGAAFGLNALTGQQGDTDVASPLSDAEASTESGDDQGDDTAQDDGEAQSDVAEAVTPTTIPGDGDSAEMATSDFGFDRAYGGANQVVAWKGGFLAWGQRFVPSEVGMADIVPDISERFPPEIIDAIRAAGIEEGDPYTLDEVTQIIIEAGLMELAQETVMSDPELLDAYGEVSAGGTYAPFVEVSSDGVNWEPVEVDLLLGENGWPQISSNGEALVLVVQNNEWDLETGRTTEQSITVHSTTDLQRWYSHELDIDVPDISPFANVDAYPSSVAAGPDSWYVSVAVNSWIDVYAALPADVIAEMNESNWGYETREEGIAIVSYPDEPAFGEEPGDEWTDEDWIAWEEAWEPTVERIVSWSDLPFTEADLYGPDMGISYAFVGDYAGNVSAAGSPAVDTYECCQVTASEAGFLTLVWEWQEYEFADGYPTVAPDIEAAYPEVGGESETSVAVEDGYFDRGPDVSLWFSPDGQIWSPRDLPETQWYDSVVAVDGGVLLLASDEGGQKIWLGSPDGSGWETVDGPDLGAQRYLWFQTHGPEGVATVVDIAEYDYAEWVAYDADFTVDGIDISLSVSETGRQDLVVSQDGQTLIEKSAQLWSSEVWDYGDDGFEVRDDDGNVVVTIDFETAEREIWAAESAAWERRQNDDPYVPEFVLVASVNGRTWFQLDLPSQPDHWYETAAISNGIVTVRAADEWQAYPIG